MTKSKIITISAILAALLVVAGLAGYVGYQRHLASAIDTDERVRRERGLCSGCPRGAQHERQRDFESQTAAHGGADLEEGTAVGRD